MRSTWRTLDRDVLRDIALVCAADALVGVSFGAITVGEGLPLWLPSLLSVVVFAGAAQFMFVGLIVSGGSPLAAAIAGLLINARHLPFGFALGDVLGNRLAQRLVGSHLMLDENVAFALAHRDLARRRAAYWACGIMLFLLWNLGVVVGAFVGTVVPDTGAFGLDAAFPAVLLALVLPAMRDPATRAAVLVGGAIALATSPFLPAGVPVLLALAGVLVTLRPDGGRGSAEDGGADSRAGNDAVEGGTGIDRARRERAGGEGGPGESSAVEATIPPPMRQSVTEEGR